MAVPGRPEPLQLIAKAAGVLDELARSGPRSAAELADRLGEPRSSVYRLLGSLEAVGFVQPGPQRGTFELGVRLFQLGSVVGQRFDVRQRALPAMEALHAATSETVVLMVRRGDEAICIERIDGRFVRLVIVEIGGAMPLHAGAAPRALLAAATDDDVARCLTGPLHRYTDDTPVDPGAIRALLAEVRRTGVSVSDGDVVPGVAAVAAPIRDHTGAVVAALSVTGPRPTILGDERTQTCDRVRSAAAEVSARLGLPDA